MFLCTDAEGEKSAVVLTTSWSQFPRLGTRWTSRPAVSATQTARPCSSSGNPWTSAASPPAPRARVASTPARGHATVPYPCLPPALPVPPAPPKTSSWIWRLTGACSPLSYTLLGHLRPAASSALCPWGTRGIPRCCVPMAPYTMWPPGRKGSSPVCSLLSSQWDIRGTPQHPMDSAPMCTL